MKDNILKCEYNVDNGYVEVYYKDGNMLRLKCEEVESRLRLTGHSQSKIWKLLDENPLEYVSMALSGEMQKYCDIEDEMVDSTHDRLLQQYLDLGYNRATAEALIRESYRYDS